MVHPCQQGMVRNKPSQTLLCPDKIQAQQSIAQKITFAPAANHAANEFFVGTYLKPSFIRKGGQVVASGWDFWQHLKFGTDGNGLL